MGQPGCLGPRVLGGRQRHGSSRGGAAGALSLGLDFPSSGCEISAKADLVVVLCGDSSPAILLKSRNEDVFLTLDGQIKLELVSGDNVCIRKAKRKTRLVLSSTKDFFEVLRTKLKWGER